MPGHLFNLFAAAALLITCQVSFGNGAECTNRSVQLVDGETPAEGWIEVCHLGMWQPVCEDLFDQIDGSVVCRQLGFSGNVIIYSNESYFDDEEDYNAFDFVSCSGSENNIFDCDHEFYDFCLAAAGIQCLDAECTNGSVRLVDGETAFEGRIEVCYFGTWWPVCADTFFGTVDGNVICRQLGHSDIIDINFDDTYFDERDDSTALSQVFCTGEEDNVFDCSYKFQWCSGFNYDVIELKCLPLPEVTTTSVVIDSTSAAGTYSTSVVSDSNVAPPTTNASTGIYNTVVIGTVVVVFGIVGGVIVVFLIVAFIIRTKKRRRFSEYDFTMRMQALQELPQNDSMSGLIRSGSHHYVELAGRFKDKNKVSEELMTSLIQPPDLKLLEKIGQGEFGIVYRGILTQHKTEPPLLAVAVKTLKSLHSQSEITDLINEAEKMKSFDHLHVLSLTGICVGLLESPCLVMPFMSNGSLLMYLRKEAPNLTVSESANENLLLDTMKQLLSMCLQVAKGMAYLAEEKFVHRDLAARNCMISSDGVIKVADFGLAEDVYTAEYFKQERSSDDSVKLPVKWMALESIHYGKFSEKTDVWSYGILCWEVFSAGKSPYPGMTPKEVVDILDSGERISKPSNPACREEVFSLMMTCWKFSPDERPAFADIVERINEILVPLAEYMDFSFTN